MSEPKTRFLVAYDYGMGGLWAAILARSENEITQKYPELEVAYELPAWMSQERFEAICVDELHDIDETTPTGVLGVIVAERLLS